MNLGRGVQEFRPEHKTPWRNAKGNLNKWTDDVPGLRYLILLRFQFSPNLSVDAI